MKYLRYEITHARNIIKFALIRVAYFMCKAHFMQHSCIYSARRANLIVKPKAIRFGFYMAEAEGLCATPRTGFGLRPSA